jgi:acyl dehydratase
MFTVRLRVGFVRPLRRTPQADASPGQSFAAGGLLRGMALLGCLTLGLPQTSSAQAFGTMQVTARVVSASVAWTGVAEAGEAARTAAREQYGRPLVRRRGLVHARAEIRPSEGRRLLIVTIQHPHN